MALSQNSPLTSYGHPWSPKKAVILHFQSPYAVVSTSLPAAVPAVPACDRADHPEPSHHRTKSKTLAANTSVEPNKAQQPPTLL
ncbi:hypothetical protein OUZ56_011979 [Daphnia magna]|uniref:Uncharacterized protein n=1 Tax=Daphnia magna TaxID=35525 RepID=A0ABQ9Z1U9_9CRUS|nr:hypothetical protein OUZ56_011979 [Daphnia magna]